MPNFIEMGCLNREMFVLKQCNKLLCPVDSRLPVESSRSELSERVSDVNEWRQKLDDCQSDYRQYRERVETEKNSYEVLVQIARETIAVFTRNESLLNRHKRGCLMLVVVRPVSRNY